MNSKNNTEKKELLKRGGKMSDGSKEKQNYKVPLWNIDFNHTLVYYDHRTSEGKKGCYFNVNTPKTEAGNRQVPMLDFVREAFVMEKQRQELLGFTAKQQ